MIELIKQRFTPAMSGASRLNLAREFLQMLCLKIMSDEKLFDQVAFVGGTALRVLFDLRRFSEDLDFSLIEGKTIDVKEVSGRFSRAFRLCGFSVEIKSRNTGAVNSLMLKFPFLMKELGLSPLQDEKLAIKWDVDTRPPDGAWLASRVVNKTFVFRIVHYDLPSLFAGKLHACFFRGYTKGRDWYDFVWYITQKVRPNFSLLNNAIRQTQKKDLGLDETNFKDFLFENIKRFDFKDLRRDVERFLEDPAELSIFDPETIQQAVRQWPLE